MTYTPVTPGGWPIVGNPDGPGIAPWNVYYGEDPWYTKS